MGFLFARGAVSEWSVRLAHYFLGSKDGCSVQAEF